MLISVNSNRLPPGWWELEEAENMWFLHDLRDMLKEQDELGYPECYYQQAIYAKKVMERVAQYNERMQSYKEMERKFKEGN